MDENSVRADIARIEGQIADQEALLEAAEERGDDRSASDIENQLEGLRRQLEGLLEDLDAVMRADES
jgi:hypothetical protein